MGSGSEHWQRVEALEKSSDAAELIGVLEEAERECWHTKTAAIRSLVAVGAGGAAILKTLARDPDPDVRQCAIEALGKLKFAQAARVLQRICDDQADPLREAARAALNAIQAAS